MEPEVDSSMDDAARAAFVAGSSAYADGDYEAALRAFSSGYALSPHPEFLFNIASCHARLHARTQALRNYQRYLEVAPEAENREFVEQQIRIIQTRLAEDEAIVETEPPPSEAGLSGLRRGAIASFAVAGAGAVVFGVAGTLALSIHNSLADCRDRGSCEAGAGDTGRVRALVADIGLGLAGAALGVGVLLWVLGAVKDSQTVFVPVVNDQGAMLALMGHY